MTAQTLVSEFHADHAKVVQALLALRSAIQDRDPARVREHPIACDGLSLYIEQLPAPVQGELLEKMNRLRQEGTTLLEYGKERSP